MKYLLLFSLLFPNFLYARSLSDTCGTWNEIAPHLSRLWETRRSKFQAFWMKSKGFDSSEFLVISEESQKSFSMSQSEEMPIYEGYFICTKKGLEKAKSYSVREHGKDFYSKIVSWGTPFEEKYWKELDFPRGLKDPVQGVFGIIKEGPRPVFHDIWGSYSTLRDKYFHDYRCDYEDHECIRNAHASISNVFRRIMKDFSSDLKERFERKLTLMNELRESEWRYREA